MAKVLIVDDSPSQLYNMQQLIEGMGHETITAEDGKEGVERARAELPDLVLMDVVMPNLNGFQATRSLSRDERTAHIPVILVTTKNQETDRLWGLRQGAKGYLTKPVQTKELVSAIGEFLPAS